MERLRFKRFSQGTRKGQGGDDRTEEEETADGRLRGKVQSREQPRETGRRWAEPHALRMMMISHRLCSWCRRRRRPRSCWTLRSTAGRCTTHGESRMRAWLGLTPAFTCAASTFRMQPPMCLKPPHPSHAHRRAACRVVDPVATPDVAQAGLFMSPEDYVSRDVGLQWFDVHQ